METHVDEDLIRQLAKKIAKDIKTEADLGDFSKLLKKIVVETALDAELTDHLGYDKHNPTGNGTGNSRNGKSRKRLKGDHGNIDLEIPRDREGTYEPQIVKKGQSRLTQMDDQILSLYAKGMSTRDITATFKELYDADVSPTAISKVTDSVIGRVNEWQARELEPLYPIVYLDCIVVKIRENQQVIKKSLYLALGVDLQGQKDLLGIWVSETEGAKFWLSVLTDLRSRGVNDILIACVDGLKGFPEAINSEYPQTQVQLCIVHMVRNSMRFVPWKDYKAVQAACRNLTLCSVDIANPDRSCRPSVCFQRTPNQVMRTSIRSCRGTPVVVPRTTVFTRPFIAHQTSWRPDRGRIKHSINEPTWFSEKRGSAKWLHGNRLQRRWRTGHLDRLCTG